MKPAVKPWADIEIFGERVEINYDNALVQLTKRLLVEPLLYDQ